MNKNIKAGGDIHAGDGGYREGTQEEYENFAKGRNQSLTKMRIKQLAEQAGLVKILDEHAHEYGNGVFENTPYPELEKFAELIVRECISELRDAFDMTIEEGNHLKEHFGVEE